MSRGTNIYSGPGGFAPATFLSQQGIACPEGYNVADFLLDVASDPPASLVRASTPTSSNQNSTGKESAADGGAIELATLEKGEARSVPGSNEKDTKQGKVREWLKNGYKTTFLTQLEVLSGREWKVLRRDYSLFLAHFSLACVLGVFVGGLYYHTDITIAGFQSRVGCLFFLVCRIGSHFRGMTC